MLRKRDSFLPFARHSISNSDIDEVVKALKSDWITMGPRVRNFEDEFSKYLECPFSIGVNSATSGLHLALDCLGINENHAVICPSVTFVATVEAICYQRAYPILIDVDSIHNLLTVEKIEEFIEKECIFTNELIHKPTKKNIKAIMPVHLAGQSCDMVNLIKLAKKYKLFIVEDAAHAFPAKHNSKFIGNWGDVTVFSFYATKGITTGEGGMITTNHEHLAEKFKTKRLHGIDLDPYHRKNLKYSVVDLGYKYNMTDIDAALGQSQLNKASVLWSNRKSLANQYSLKLQEIGEIKLPYEESKNEHSWHLYRISVDPNKRDELSQFLKDYNIGTSLHFVPIYQHPYYQNTYSYKIEDYPNSEKMFQSTLSLPIFPDMKIEDVDYIVDVVKLFFTRR